MPGKHSVEAPRFLPRGWPQVIPRLSVENPQSAVDFIKHVFDARGEYQEERPTELWIGDSLIMIGGVVERDTTRSFLYLYVADTDKSYNLAIEAGATSVEAPAEMPYGDRRAMVEDPWGNRWQIATHRQFSE